MTLHSRLAELYRQLAEAHEQLALEQATDWVDQTQSPLGRRRHCALVRSGALPGRRIGRRVLVPRSALDESIRGEAKPATADTKDNDEDEQLLLSIGMRRAS